MSWPFRITLILLVVATGLVCGYINLRRSITQELEESAKAIDALNQGYEIAGIEGVKGGPQGAPKADAAPIVKLDELPLVELPNRPIDELHFSDGTRKHLDKFGVKDVSGLLKLARDPFRLFELEPETLNEISAKINELKQAARAKS